jgi:hypothetical protein
MEQPFTCWNDRAGAEAENGEDREVSAVLVSS